MDQKTMRDRLAAARVGHLATVGADHRPHIVPCCFTIVHDTLYSAVDGKPKSTRALRRLENIRVEPSASLLVDYYSDDWEQLWWVRVDANGRIVEPGTELEDAVIRLRAKYEQYQREAPEGPVVALDIVRWRGWP